MCSVQSSPPGSHRGSMAMQTLHTNLQVPSTSPASSVPKPRQSPHLRLFWITFAANMSVFIALTATHQANTGKISYTIISNIFVFVLMWQEYVINTLFSIFTAWPQSAPLTIRRILACIFHISGCKCLSTLPPCHPVLTNDASVHSRCSISAIIWLILFMAMGTCEYIHRPSPVRTLHLQFTIVTNGTQISLATIVVSWVILGLLLVMLIFAYPNMRNRFHDSFEWTHHFLGRTTLALVWTKIVLFINDGRKPGKPLPHACKHNTAFWLQCIITGSIVLPQYIVTPTLQYILDPETSHRFTVHTLASGLGPWDTQVDDTRLKLDRKKLQIGAQILHQRKNKRGDEARQPLSASELLWSVLDMPSLFSNGRVSLNGGLELLLVDDFRSSPHIRSMTITSTLPSCSPAADPCGLQTFDPMVVLSSGVEEVEVQCPR